MHTPDEDYITEMITPGEVPEVPETPEAPETPAVAPEAPLNDDEFIKKLIKNIVGVPSVLSDAPEAPVDQIDIEIVIKKEKLNGVLNVLNPLNVVGSTLILYGAGGLYKHRYTYSNYSKMHSDVYFSMFMLFGAMIMST